MLHQAVAGHLRDDRGCGNRRHDAVAADYRLHLAIERQAVAAVDENITWPARERIHGTGERPQARPQDIVAVDARRRRDANRDLSGRRDLLEEDVALFGIEHFGIIKALRYARGIEDHRRRHDRPGPWAPARFVASGDRREPEAILPRLAGEGRATARRRFFVLDHGAGFRNSVIDLTYLYFSFFPATITPITIGFRPVPAGREAMQYDDFRRSDNIEDRRGDEAPIGIPGVSSGGLGIGGLIIVGLISWALGIDPRLVLGGLEMVQGARPPMQQTGGPARPAGTPTDAQGQFVAAVLGDSEDRWTEIFAENNRRYERPRLVLFTRATRSACGFAQSAMGPFYCPNDQRVYLDTSFFDDLQRKFQGCSGAACKFSYAYVITHEIGHHVQNLLGILP